MSARRTSRPAGERGMVLLVLLFLAAVMLVAASAAALRLVNQGRREKEAEMVWRGEQYVRAIRLYYRRYGQFPRTFEDFSKNPGNLHFLRKEYKDPMNSTDGSWRYIYVGPTGQLMGSLTRSLPIGIIPLGGQQTGVGGAFAPGQGASPSPFGSLFSAAGNAPGIGAATGTTGAVGAAGGAPSPSATGSGAPTSQGSGSTPPLDASGLPSDLSGIPGLTPPGVQPPHTALPGVQTLDSPVIGGQLVGIGSKVDRKSILFYKGYGKYREWEFLWDPAQDAAAAGGLPTGAGALPTGIGGPQPAPAPQGSQPPGIPPPTPPQ
ncbi:MAG TPA: hypothetical protein VL099_04980 [Candidatus Binatia bacterium]|nr:hypothetical protein [Candidatus Binatia bacterium]